MYLHTSKGDKVNKGGINMVLYLKNPVHDEDTGMIVLGNKATFAEIVAFLKSRKEKYLGCYLAAPNVTCLEFEGYRCLYNESKKNLCLHPEDAYDKYFRVKGWSELLGGVSNV